MVASREQLAEILEIVRNNPGLDSEGVFILMKSSSSADNTNHGLTKLFRKGSLARTKIGRRYHYSVANQNPSPQPSKLQNAVRRSAKMNQIQERITEMQTTIDDLLRWKANAIARFPILDLDPKVKRAREIVAQIYEVKNDRDMVRKVNDGRLDLAPIMLATLTALDS